MQQCRLRLKGTADDPVSIGGDVLLTRADRQRYRIPIYNLTTSQPLPDVKGEGNLAIHFDNSAFHSLFPDAELASVRIPRPPDRASPEEVAAHQARMRELVEQGIEIDGQRYHLVPGLVFAKQAWSMAMVVPTQNGMPSRPASWSTPWTVNHSKKPP
jgi:hypothetical protein